MRWADEKRSAALWTSAHSSFDSIPRDDMSIPHSFEHSHEAARGKARRRQRAVKTKGKRVFAFGNIEIGEDPIRLA
jgi:hypothetical protein